jgi:hypothetical protein
VYFITVGSFQASYPKSFHSSKIQFGIRTPPPKTETMGGISYTVSTYPTLSGSPEYPTNPSPPSPLLTQEGRRQDRHEQEDHFEALRNRLEADIAREREEGRATRAAFRQEGQAQELQRRVLQRTYAGVRDRRLRSHRRERGTWQNTVNRLRGPVHENERAAEQLSAEIARLQAQLDGINEVLPTQRANLNHARGERDFYENAVVTLERNPQSIGTRAFSEEPPSPDSHVNYNDQHNAALYNNAYREVYGHEGYRQNFGDEAYAQAFGAEAYRRAFGDRAYRQSFGDETYAQAFGIDAFRRAFGNRATVEAFGFQETRAGAGTVASGRRTPQSGRRTPRSQTGIGSRTPRNTQGPFAPPPQPVRVNTQPDITQHADLVHRPLARSFTEPTPTGQADGSSTRTSSPSNDGREGGATLNQPDSPSTERAHVNPSRAENRPPRTSTTRHQATASSSASTPRTPSRQRIRRQSEGGFLDDLARLAKSRK